MTMKAMPSQGLRLALPDLETAEKVGFFLVAMLSL
jgi:hypothetical protein